MSTAINCLDIMADFYNAKERGDDFSALHIAAKHGDLDLVKESITRLRLAVDAKTLSQTTPLMLATEHGHLDCMEFLLQAGADVNLSDDLNRNALHQAARSCFIRDIETFKSVISLLVKYKIDVNAKENLSGDTALLALAAWKNNLRIPSTTAWLNTLIDCTGIDPFITDKTGQTALDSCRLKHCPADRIALIENYMDNYTRYKARRSAILFMNAGESSDSKPEGVESIASASSSDSPASAASSDSPASAIPHSAETIRTLFTWTNDQHRAVKNMVLSFIPSTPS